MSAAQYTDRNASLCWVRRASLERERERERERESERERATQTMSGMSSTMRTGNGVRASKKRGKLHICLNVETAVR